MHGWYRPGVRFHGRTGAWRRHRRGARGARRWPSVGSWGAARGSRRGRREDGPARRRGDRRRGRPRPRRPGGSPAGASIDATVTVSDVDDLDPDLVDVLVDLTRAESRAARSRGSAAHGKDAVVGTSGLGADDLDGPAAPPRVAARGSSSCPTSRSARCSSSASRRAPRRTSRASRWSSCTTTRSATRRRARRSRRPDAIARSRRGGGARRGRRPDGARDDRGRARCRRGRRRPGPQRPAAGAARAPRGPLRVARRRASRSATTPTTAQSYMGGSSPRCGTSTASTGSCVGLEPRARRRDGRRPRRGPRADLGGDQPGDLRGRRAPDVARGHRAGVGLLEGDGVPALPGRARRAARRARRLRAPPLLRAPRSAPSRTPRPSRRSWSAG